MLLNLRLWKSFPRLDWGALWGLKIEWKHKKQWFCSINTTRNFKDALRSSHWTLKYNSLDWMYFAIKTFLFHVIRVNQFNNFIILCNLALTLWLVFLLDPIYDVSRISNGCIKCFLYCCRCMWKWSFLSSVTLVNFLNWMLSVGTQW